MSRTILFLCVLLLLSSFLVQSVQCHQPAGDVDQHGRKFITNLVSLEVSDHCATTISKAIPTAGKPSASFPLTPPLPNSLESFSQFDPRTNGMHGMWKSSNALRYMVVYSLEGKEYGHIFLDPRIRIAEGRHGPHPYGRKDQVRKDGTVPSEYFLVEKDAEMIWIPIGVERVKVYCHNTSSFNLHVIQEEGQRKLSTQATVDYNVYPIHDVGPATKQLNIVFLSGGYTQSEAKSYNDTINAIVGLLNDPNVAKGGENTVSDPTALKNQHKSVPIDRYWEFFNVYSIFQASAQSGASRPAIGEYVTNNLGCYHPATMERAITCNIQKSYALAAVSPADVRTQPDKTLIVVIVNTKMYGGTGIFKQGKLHLCHFYQGVDEKTGTRDDDKYTSLINHEMGHAIGNLFDEYDIGITEPSPVPLSNCQAPTAGGPPNPLQWSYWQPLMADSATAAYYRGEINDLDIAGQHEWTVGNPLVVCGYSNYYKPSDHCMMHKVRDYFMCPVCRESEAIQIIDGSGFEYQWPRWPLPDPILIVPKTANETGMITMSSGLILHLPTVLTGANNFQVIWFDRDGVTPITKLQNSGCLQCLELTSTIMSKWPENEVVTIKATILDYTNFISSSTTNPKNATVKGLKQSAEFKLKVVQSIDGLVNVSKHPPVSKTKGNFGIYQLDALNSYQQCLFTPGQPDPVCKLSFTVKVYQSPEDLGAAIAAFDQWVLYVVAGIGVLFIVLWVWAVNFYSQKSKNVVRPIFKTEFTGFVSFIRKVMVFSAVCFMFASLGAMGMSIYYYLKISAIGKIIVLAGMILAIGLYIMAFVGFWAVAYRSKKLVLINGGILFFGLLVLIGFDLLVITIGKDIKQDDSFWTKQLETLWIGLVQNNPQRACALEGMLECSGFFLACNGVVGSTLYCPTDCEETNQRYATSCKQLLQDYISQGYTTILAVVVGATCLMLFGIIFNFIYFWKLVQMKRSIREQQNSRLHRHASSKNISASQVDRCKALYILKTLDHDDVKGLIKEFRRIDIDGNGQLDRREMHMFFKKALMYTPSAVELDKIFEVGDLDHDKTISLYEFLMMFNPEAAKQWAQDQSLKANWKAQADPNREDEIKRRMAQHYAGTGLVEEEMMAKTSGQQHAYRPPCDHPPDPPGLL